MHFYPLLYAFLAYLRTRQILLQTTRKSPPSDPCPPHVSSVFLWVPLFYFMLTRLFPNKKYFQFKLRNLSLLTEKLLLFLLGKVSYSFREFFFFTKGGQFLFFRDSKRETFPSPTGKHFPYHYSNFLKGVLFPSNCYPTLLHSVSQP